jgi:hypothetical protein
MILPADDEDDDEDESARATRESAHAEAHPGLGVALKRMAKGGALERVVVASVEDGRWDC